MSFYTLAERFYLDDAGVFDVAGLSPRIDALVDKLGYSRDVADDARRLLSEGRSDFAINSWALIELMADIAALAPQTEFAVRGVGEDPRMIWVREYAKGRETYAFGPPEDAEG
jgi:hypothetical protein